ncbi:uncharacterized protein LOC114516630 [Dendronephthya gigantea]|uniref:uncharacterized protein LOC114516630 n=1 Tax=Dendronephthya gigantea TaxID=151771 RepID=UPI00106976A6|nr:uncharacterized protein LOC114516630 [Dendronephthya gigantea]
MMESEWHVSDSDEEHETGRYTQFMLSNLKGLNCTLSNQDKGDEILNLSSSSHTTDQYIPKNLNALYTQIENNGYIALQCKGSKRRLESIKDETHSVNNHTNATTNSTCIVNNTNESPVVDPIEDEASSTNKSAVKKSEFDYVEEMDTMPAVRLPRRKQKSEHNKYGKTKRVGKMENVINDLSRYKRLNAQVMAADSTNSMSH